MKNNTIEDLQVFEHPHSPENNCPMTNTLKIIGGKWKLLLLNSIRKECPARFGELRKKMHDITQATLTAQLRELERDGIILRTVYPEAPPRVEYKLTELGKTLIPVIQAICDWGETHSTPKKPACHK
jgi:DNA-binding HxlR family transcriptional regulator